MKGAPHPCTPEGVRDYDAGRPPLNYLPTQCPSSFFKGECYIIINKLTTHKNRLLVPNGLAALLSIGRHKAKEFELYPLRPGGLCSSYAIQ